MFNQLFLKLCCSLSRLRPIQFNTRQLLFAPRSFFVLPCNNRSKKVIMTHCKKKTHYFDTFVVNQTPENYGRSHRNQGCLSGKISYF